ncbi:MAG TPA: c-type cytochrome [Saprospiraceae bacterium]|nr:c-type cytochrome [Saprospiraceae bacterium]
MKKLLSFLKWTGLVLVLVIAGFYIFVRSSWNKKFTAPYPEIKASTDSTIIARGRYLAYGPAHCATCHVPMDKIMDVENGDTSQPLSGGWTLSIPPGTFVAPNLTPDVETGIGKLTDAEIARTLRYMVGSDNRCIFPFMPFAELSDEDLTAVVSFLRSQPPVKHELKRTQLTFMGKAIMAMGMIKPSGTKGNPPKSVKIDTTVEYGHYLANYVSNCVGCHTKRDLKTGAFIGKPFSGGMYFEPDQFSGGRSFVTPNLTPDPNTSILANYSETSFLTRFRAGRVNKGSPMPWGSFGRMTDNDIKAIYHYLQSLDPVPNKIEKTVYEPGQKYKG